MTCDPVWGWLRWPQGVKPVVPWSQHAQHPTQKISLWRPIIGAWELLVQFGLANSSMVMLLAKVRGFLGRQWLTRDEEGLTDAVKQVVVQEPGKEGDLINHLVHSTPKTATLAPGEPLDILCP